ncbi:conserved hypothetical protein [Ricinus communis]|uniref:Uncharacterized protein n=1 Tax=Ricinus communis TaxID=3988 RepID=B9SJC1_RICCO|nr:conserved hypothetical protein [Ricinus communis]
MVVCNLEKPLEILAPVIPDASIVDEILPPAPADKKQKSKYVSAYTDLNDSMMTIVLSAKDKEQPDDHNGSRGKKSDNEY